VAPELGIAPESLRRWAHQVEIAAGQSHRFTSEEREKLRRLRRESVTLREAGGLLYPGHRSVPIKFHVMDEDEADHRVSTYVARRV